MALPHERTLFHLVPKNNTAWDALNHPDNRRFVSRTSQTEPALEVGFHVASVPGRVLARLGRNADLILPQRTVSSVHIAFELHPDTLVVLLSVRARRSPPILVTPRDRPQESIRGEYVLSYDREYLINVVGNIFNLEWWHTGTQSLRDRASQGYEDALREQANIRSRHLPTEISSEVHTWHHTRIHSAGPALFREADGAPRVPLGEGQFGTVSKAIDSQSGHTFAIKVIRLENYGDVDQARAVAHREVKALQKLEHKNIIEFLGHSKWDTNYPEIFMPLREGNLRTLRRLPVMPMSENKLSSDVLEQMLSALDYLASKDMCHRDLKPENILYWRDGPTSFTFQLADFGLANHRLMAVTKCGTTYYEAPELYPQYGTFQQSPKMDVWSLFATIADIHPLFTFPPFWARTYDDVLQAIRDAAAIESRLAPMAREDPTYRASAAQMLVAVFAGRGLTTPRNQVPPLRPMPVPWF